MENAPSSQNQARKTKKSNRKGKTSSKANKSAKGQNEETTNSGKSKIQTQSAKCSATGQKSKCPNNISKSSPLSDRKNATNLKDGQPLESNTAAGFEERPDCGQSKRRKGPKTPPEPKSDSCSARECNMSLLHEFAKSIKIHLYTLSEYIRIIRANVKSDEDFLLEAPTIVHYIETEVSIFTYKYQGFMSTCKLYDCGCMLFPSDIKIRCIMHRDAPKNDISQPNDLKVSSQPKKYDECGGPPAPPKKADLSKNVSSNFGLHNNQPIVEKLNNNNGIELLLQAIALNTVGVEVEQKNHSESKESEKKSEQKVEFTSAKAVRNDLEEKPTQERIDGIYVKKEDEYTASNLPIAECIKAKIETQKIYSELLKNNNPNSLKSYIATPRQEFNDPWNSPPTSVAFIIPSFCTEDNIAIAEEFEALYVNGSIRSVNIYKDFCVFGDETSEEEEESTGVVICDNENFSDERPFGIKDLSKSDISDCYQSDYYEEIETSFEESVEYPKDGQCILYPVELCLKEEENHDDYFYVSEATWREVFSDAPAYCDGPWKSLHPGGDWRSVEKEEKKTDTSQSRCFEDSFCNSETSDAEWKEAENPKLSPLKYESGTNQMCSTMMKRSPNSVFCNLRKTQEIKKNGSNSTVVLSELNGLLSTDLKVGDLPSIGDFKNMPFKKRYSRHLKSVGKKQ